MTKISHHDPILILQKMFSKALEVADPKICVPPVLPPPPLGKTIFLGAGKAAASMARAVEQNWDGQLSGIAVTREGYGVPCKRIEVIEASHPIPDVRSHRASKKILELAHTLRPTDLCIAAISGGASSLLSAPIPGLKFGDKQEINRLLLKSGASISEINTVRKHLSRIKGGRLAEAIFPAHLSTILISDVPGDDPATIGSGPTVPDNTTSADALAVLKKFNINQPSMVYKKLANSESETPKEGSKFFENTKVVTACIPMHGLESAANFAHSVGLKAHIISDRLQGDSKIVAKSHAKLALNTMIGNGPVTPPCVLLSGGETTVAIKGDGRGGPNTEYALALAIELKGNKNVYGIACDTDGIDGSENNAGAIITPEFWSRAQRLGLTPNNYLENNDSFSFFEKIDSLIFTGPTFTNINDFRALLVLP